MLQFHEIVIGQGTTFKNDIGPQILRPDWWKLTRQSALANNANGGTHLVQGINSYPPTGTIIRFGDVWINVSTSSFGSHGELIPYKVVNQSGIWKYVGPETQQLAIVRQLDPWGPFVELLYNAGCDLKNDNESHWRFFKEILSLSNPEDREERILNHLVRYGNVGIAEGRQLVDSFQ